METVSVLLLIANIALGYALVKMRSEISQEKLDFEHHCKALEVTRVRSEDALRLQLETERRVIESFHETARDRMLADRADINNTRKSFLLEVAKVAQARRVRA